MNRYLREKSMWESHLVRTRKFICESFSGRSPSSLAILGSGWLLDVPLDELMERFSKIYLVDICHPAQIRKKVSPLKNVNLVESDLTGGAINHLWQLVNGKYRHEDLLAHERLVLTPPVDHLPVDAVISVNMLNQLDIIPFDFLGKHRQYQQTSLDPLRERIQSFHVEWITRTPGCLITDSRERTLDSKGDTVAVKPLLYTRLPAGIRNEQWDWEFDTHGAYRPGSLTRMEVEAVEWE